MPLPCSESRRNASAVVAGPEVGVAEVDVTAVDGVVAVAVGVELGGRSAHRRVGVDVVRVGVRGHPPGFSLGEQAVPQPAHGRGHPVETSPRPVALQRISGEGIRAGGVVVATTPRTGAVRSRDTGALVPGRALHTHRDSRLRVAPATDLVRRVDPLARGVCHPRTRSSGPPRSNLALTEASPRPARRLARLRPSRSPPLSSTMDNTGMGSE
jgi:hypothetical protein